MLTRRSLLATATAASALMLTSTSALAAKPKIFADGGSAINGYDPVAYFTQSAPVQGSDEFTSDYEGALFKFSSADNKAMFDADPLKFAPQYGGYCAYAVSKGSTATTSPDAWSIVDGKLYLNFNTTVRGIWSEDIPGNISKADNNWPAVLE
jgi:YHS domain-containing protein